MIVSEAVQSIAAVATAIGVAIAAWQLYLTKQQERSQFEDGFYVQYRELASKIPLEALLGKPMSEEEIRTHLRAFYNYFDLSNEQAFLADRKRLRSSTWRNWEEGIGQNLSRPAFRKAWLLLEPDLDGSFSSLRKLIQQLTLGA